MEVVNLEHLEAARFYLFGDVKFLHLLLLLMALDIVTGIFKAWKNDNLWSRKSLFGYARKVLILVVIILANVIDQILSLNGMVAYATVLFYMANEGLSIIENLAEVGVLVPTNIANKLRNIEDTSQRITEEVREEFSDKEDV
ncbi:phage holin family protein [Amphibacillus jilinensis]|uniref:phage holin family protein n=1 Tax=Amphibacillus jilinensis TaxID=1216008 RepID=UPI00030F64EA|nr:phage holin family protein [Amphibacillus jilinensis]